MNVLSGTSSLASSRRNCDSRLLPDPLHFAVVWVVGLHHVEAGEYVYSVTRLDVSDGDTPTWLIRIASDFDSWVIEQIQ